MLKSQLIDEIKRMIRLIVASIICCETNITGVLKIKYLLNKKFMKQIKININAYWPINSPANKSTSKPSTNKIYKFKFMKRDAIKETNSAMK